MTRLFNKNTPNKSYISSIDVFEDQFTLNKNVKTIKYDKKDGGKKCNEKCVHYCHDHDISGRSNAPFFKIRIT